MTSEARHFCDICGVTEENIKCNRDDRCYYLMFVIKMIKKIIIKCIREIKENLRRI